LKVPIKPPWMPDVPDKNDKKSLPDENTWIYVAFERLEKKISESIEPLEQYLKTLHKFKAEYQLDPVAIIAKLDDDENPPEAETLRKDIIFHKKEAERLMIEIPDQIIVSMFQINVASIRDLVVAKHIKIANDEIELVAKSAKRMANSTIEAFYKINDKINTSPKDIEELSAIKDYMSSVPQEIEKLDGQIKLGMQVYKILEDFKYKFPDEEDYDK
jgi:HAMP domain-containing protein